MTTRTDFAVEPKGSLWLLTGLSPRAKQWLTLRIDSRCDGETWLLEAWFLPWVTSLIHEQKMTISWTEHVHDRTSTTGN
jgi:hypothetical protein